MSSPLKCIQGLDSASRFLQRKRSLQIHPVLLIFGLTSHNKVNPTFKTLWRPFPHGQCSRIDRESPKDESKADPSIYWALNLATNSVEKMSWLLYVASPNGSDGDDDESLARDVHASIPTWDVSNQIVDIPLKGICRRGKAFSSLRNMYFSVNLRILWLWLRKWVA